MRFQRFLSTGLREWPLITKDTPTVQDAKELKGVLGTINQYFYSSRIMPPQLINKNRFFKSYYFPSDHLLGLFRKSKPAIRIKYEDGYMLNNIKFKDFNKSKFGKSLNPMDYSFMRVKVRRLIREIFLKNYLANEGVDGLYVINLNLIPKEDELQEFESKIVESLNNVKKLNKKVFRIEQLNKRVNWDQVKYLLELDNYKMSDELIKMVDKRKPQKNSN